MTQPPEPPPWGPPQQPPPPQPPPPQQPSAYPPPSSPPPQHGHPQQPYPQRPYPQQPYLQQPYPQQPYPQQPYPYGGQPPRGGGSARLWVALAVGLVVVLLAVLVPVLVLSGDDDEPAAREDRSQSPDGGDGGQPSTDLSEVQEFDDLPTTHVTEPVDYEQVPPVGGEHYGEWLDCGVYDEPVPDENAVHDLEHGTVWITHDPDLPAEDLETLAGQLPQNGIMSPYDGLPAPVVVTVWERQLALTGADDPRLELFVQEFQDGVTAPEPFASCAGGTADLGGGSGVPA